jgi:diguanylate cyclase (GGDEF)-like protein
VVTVVSRPTVFWRYVAVSLAAIPVYFLLPPAGQNLVLLGSNLVACFAIVSAVRTRRLAPRSGWLLLAGFPAATAVGNGVYFVNDSILHVSPFPSLGDVGFLGGYLLLAAGLLRLQHARNARLDVPAMLDTSIITVGFAAASWVIFGAPLMQDEVAPLFERLTALGYPVANVMVLAVAARFFLTSRRRGSAYAWLAGTVVVMLVSDTTFAVLNLLDAYQTGHPVDALILGYNLGWGAIALHPGAGELTVAAPQAARPSRWRLIALTAASLIAPGVLVVQVLTEDYDDLVVTAGASALLFLLVVGRMFGLVRRLEQVLTQRQALEAELDRRAHHDDLTGLANRRMFTEQLQRSLERPAGSTEVLYLDLDRFKSINDSLGHAAGDTLLTVTAARLRTSLLPQDTIARLGGDEFAVLLAGQSDGRVLSDVRDALTAALALPVPLHGLEVQVTASVGHARSRPGDTAEDLMHRADTAMYEEKTRTDRRRQAMATTGRAAPQQSRPADGPAAAVNNT